MSRAGADKARGGADVAERRSEAVDALWWAESSGRAKPIAGAVEAAVRREMEGASQHAAGGEWHRVQLVVTLIRTLLSFLQPEVRALNPSPLNQQPV